MSSELNIIFGLILAIISIVDVTALETSETIQTSVPLPYQKEILRFKRQFDNIDPSLQQTIQNLQAQQQNGNSGFNGQSFGQRPLGSNQFQSGSQLPSWNNPNQGGFNSGNFNQNTVRPQTTQRPLVNLISNENTVNEAECIRNCPATNQWNPVCGTDNISYGNVNKLRCAQQCGRQVAFVYNGSCVTTRAPNKK